MTGTTQALHDLPAHALLRAYRERSLSPVEVMHELLAHVQRWEPALGATYLLRPEAALAQARASEARWLRGEPAGLLDGVPATVKDNIATRGDPTPVGTAAMPQVAAPLDAPPAARLREAGAILFAKTTMPDYGMLSSGLSSLHGNTFNPWDLDKTPGGSSAGAGAAAAAGYGPLHVGTDIGGSIRLPAGWCGIFGLKPSLGRVPIDPPYTGRCAGPMTRSVADAALMMQALSLPDARDSMGLPHQDIAWSGFDMDPAQVRGLRIGLLLDAGCGLPLQPRVRAVVEQAAAWLESAGAHIEIIQPWLTRDMLDGLDHFWRMRSHVEMQSLPDAQRRVVLPFIRDWADSAGSITATQLFVASQQSHLLRVATVRATAAFDYVLSPVAPITAFPAHLPSPTNDPLRPLEHIAFTVPYNMSEQPAASVPCGHDGQLPIGVQIAGRRFDDLGVLRLSRVLEQLRPPQPAWPQPLPPGRGTGDSEDGAQARARAVPATPA
ncbi:aspartyl-tRNA(Asn)/glutamyl-tRNA(Gln) amidotransferase subunit A [Delftia sp. 60]|uniref:amidase n=1 Tax=Delftia sp. 60 TaxID=2035216 RepID=UPI000C18F1D9|nr:amidase [Delftia sp. 60]PIF36075.1 aspartyl-tRNA(Asn)/glutamyl-tRNA(Gln) amidotransferase subunit A [Burkholderiales bacterium 23]PIF68742.1 aspartyl-tRNA(Asn)/glutamyl-tRNA(Gln) amidotransferase subunit A [Delftia sp. 60]